MRRKTLSLPMMMTNLMMASWETIPRRTLLVAQNKCSPAKYQRMLREKALAAARSGLSLVSSGDLCHRSPTARILVLCHH